MVPNALLKPSHLQPRLGFKTPPTRKRTTRLAMTTMKRKTKTTMMKKTIKKTKRMMKKRTMIDNVKANEQYGNNLTL